MSKVFLRTEFNYDMDEASAKSGLACLDPSMAQQQFLEESDINTIVERFGLNGEMPANVKAPVYGDFTGISDFQTAMNTVIAAQESFMSLPAKVRARFENDPQQFLEFCSDEANRDEARSLGLLDVLTPEAPVSKVPPVEAPKPE